MTVSEPSQPSAAPGFHPQSQSAPSQSRQVPYQVPIQHYQQPVQVIAAKSPGVAVLLTFFWLGAGHLYAGATGTGIALVLFELFIVLPLSFLFVGVILWFLTVPFVMFLAAEAAKSFNRRNGIIVR